MQQRWSRRARNSYNGSGAPGDSSEAQWLAERASTATSLSIGRRLPATLRPAAAISGVSEYSAPGRRSGLRR